MVNKEIHIELKPKDEDFGRDLFDAWIRVSDGNNSTVLTLVGGNNEDDSELSDSEFWEYNSKIAREIDWVAGQLGAKLIIDPHTKMHLEKFIPSGSCKQCQKIIEES